MCKKQLNRGGMSGTVVVVCKRRCMNVNVTSNTHANTACAQQKKKKKKETKQTPKKSDSDGFQIVICVTIFPGGQEVETSISKRRAFSYPVYDWFIIFVWKPHVGFTYNNNLTSCCKASLTLHSGCIENKMKRAFLRTFVPLIGLLPTLHDMVVLKVLFKNNNNCFAFSFFLISLLQFIQL